MGKVEGIIKSEIVRLAKREMKKSFSPLNQDVRSLKGTLSQLRKSGHRPPTIRGPTGESDGGTEASLGGCPRKR